jgi:MraZ protein
VEDAVRPAKVEPPLNIYPGRVDEKGRLKLPVDFQQYLNGLGETRVFMTTLDGRIGRIYPISVWRENEAMLREAGEDAEAGDDLWFFASALGGDAEMDAQGRLLLPAALRQHLGVEGEPVYLHSYRGHIRLYTQAVYDEKMGRATAALGDKLRAFEKKGLR